MSNIVTKAIDLNGETMSFETGKLAKQANAAVVAKWGDTVLLATVAMGNPPQGLDYFPLTVEYIEKYYAGGIISSSRFVKRERFPANEAILKARIIDRSIRPLFPETFKHEVQVIITVLAYDEVHDPAILAVNAASAALMISDVPFEGPVAGVAMSMVGGNFKFMPLNGEVDDSELNLTLSITDDAVVMIEADAKEMKEDKILEGIESGMNSKDVLLDVQRELQKEAGKEKFAFVESEKLKELETKVLSQFGDDIKKAMVSDKAQFKKNEEELKERMFEAFEGESKGDLSDIVFKAIKNEARRMVIEDDIRLDGRGLDEVRKLTSEVGLLPRVHGSGLFTRGETQVLSVVTLASGSRELLVEGMEGEEKRTYMHHYNFPPFSAGEAGRYRYMPGRREIGHGALAEKALIPVLPSSEDFPYTIRVVSEVMASDGSTSMASTCGSSLSLMDAGVPIKKAVGGIAMGLISDGKSYKVLTDIAGFEDHIGDMDFKVTGTKDGVTAIQMDNKLKGIPFEVLAEGLQKANTARLLVIESILSAIAESRPELNPLAPKIKQVKINRDRIGELIGPGGKVIKGIIERTGVDMDIDDEKGLVSISSSDLEAIARAIEMVEDIILEAEVGKIYTGVVDKIMPFGAFVDVSPSISGLVHVSEMADTFVKDPNEYVKEGQTVRVKVLKIDDQGKVSMSMKAVEKDSK